ncbi:tetratricopeptide repeat protein [Ostreibacterium oceani]|uniref:Lipopolysaccharide assembly protein B n=1 Tax=Ostreibacterium oceani TaxID=2654998 RepID=A0A6N7F3V2_9GAMM|nr:tetratricopeptide repeat protein [Ostreibacterium oceani]MPV86556.1 tetratricopeptide repeat protein [Ostreibacterium oceani]
MNELLVLLLPLAAFSGWWIAKGDKKKDHHRRDEDYFQGLSYLLENETDKAIDIFVRIAHLDDSAIENQITLGNLFRHRGEIDRALHIHTALLSRQELSSEALQRLHLALADDYLQAGVMNHAKDYLEKANAATSPALRDAAQRRLINLYEQQDQWQQAIEVAEALDPFRRDSIQQKVAHYYCELAEAKLSASVDTPSQSNQSGQSDLSMSPSHTALAGAEEWLNKALICDKQCLRALIKLGEIAQLRGNYVQAINYYQRLEKIAPTFMLEVFDKLAACYDALNQHHEWKNYLATYVRKYPSPALLLHLQQSIAHIEGDEAAKKFLGEQLTNHPSLLTLHAYLHQLDHQDESIKTLQFSLDRIIRQALRYRCRECGFRGNVLNWQCPGCKNWGAFTPVTDLTVKENV